jgi:hypothetical protein
MNYKYFAATVGFFNDAELRTTRSRVVGGFGFSKAFSQCFNCLSK